MCDVRVADRGERNEDGTLIGLGGILQDIAESENAECERGALIERITPAMQTGKLGI